MSSQLTYQSHVARRDRESQAMMIRARIERRYAKLRSISPVNRRTLVERDIRAALEAAGLPLPRVVSADERMQHKVWMVRRDPAAIRHIPRMERAAVIAALRESDQ